MKKLSCGGIIFSPNGKFLIARPRWDSPDWNIPKGEITQGETPERCAILEIQEETGITLHQYNHMFNLGQYPYLKNKDVHLFYIILSVIPSKLVCSSYYEENGKKIPEMIDFKWIDWDERQKFLSKAIGNVLNLVKLPNI
jgi:8-oxo-dGTP pyrophosphatase MutT (NUDIX family)